MYTAEGWVCKQLRDGCVYTGRVGVYLVEEWVYTQRSGGCIRSGGTSV